MAKARLRAKRMVNLGKQPNGKLLYWTIEEVKNGIVKEAEITPLIERYINDGLLELLEVEKKKKPRRDNKKESKTEKKKK